jgi:hypothetical protein
VSSRDVGGGRVLAKRFEVAELKALEAATRAGELGSLVSSGSIVGGRGATRTRGARGLEVHAAHPGGQGVVDLVRLLLARASKEHPLDDLVLEALRVLVEGIDEASSQVVVGGVLEALDDGEGVLVIADVVAQGEELGTEEYRSWMERMSEMVLPEKRFFR